MTEQKMVLMHMTCPLCGQTSRSVMMPEGTTVGTRRHDSKASCVKALGKALNELKELQTVRQALDAEMMDLPPLDPVSPLSDEHVGRLVHD